MTEEYPLTDGGFRYISWIRCNHRGAVAGVPGGWGADRLAATYQPDRLDFLWPGTTLRGAAVHDRIRRLRPAGEYRAALGRVRGVVLDVDRIRQPYPGSILDAVVSRRSATVSLVADCGVGNDLGSCHNRTWGCLHAGYFAHPQICGESLRIVGVIAPKLTTYGFFGVSRILGYDAAVDQPSRCALFGHTSAAPCEGR